MAPAISVTNLGKMYRLSHQTKRTDSFREAITSTLMSPLRRLKQLRGTDESMEEFWALKDVSFDVQPGEVVGIIGRNGAGKSTLLKILSRIVEPTTGEIRLRGRVASLLEVGTGFHPELTGRENIYLNGSILGMKKREIDRKFDEIVDFAEVEKFLDTPVKRYSSGMYVRLAFAVAAHLDPEILIVDEVLAVGDAEFQKKCLGKMKEVSTGRGRTVLFVSHNMLAVQALCQSGIFLENGSVSLCGPSVDVVNMYHKLGKSTEGDVIKHITETLKWQGISNRSLLSNLSSNQDIKIELSFKSVSRDLNRLNVDIALFDEKSRMAVHCRGADYSNPMQIPKNIDFSVIVQLNNPQLSPGNYNMTVYATEDREELCWIENIDALSISGLNPYKAGAMFEGIRGVTLPYARHTLITK